MRTKQIAFLAMMIALAIVLEFISSRMFEFVWHSGGHPSLSMIPIVIVAWRKNWWSAMIIAVIVGVAQVPYFYKPVQYLLDYPLAFAALGLAGILVHFAKNEIQERIFLSIGIVLASFIRFLSHVTSGFVFFSDVINPATIGYNLSYNSFVFITALITIYVINIGFKQFKDIKV